MLIMVECECSVLCIYTRSGSLTHRAMPGGPLPRRVVISPLLIRTAVHSTQYKGGAFVALAKSRHAMIHHLCTIYDASRRTFQ